MIAAKVKRLKTTSELNSRGEAEAGRESESLKFAQRELVATLVGASVALARIFAQIAASPWFDRLARLGYAAEGLLYVIVAAQRRWRQSMPAGRVRGTRGALDLLVTQPFGRLVVALVAVGLCGYILRRFVQVFVPPTDGVPPRNYFAVCAPTNGVFYFGEAVDDYKDGQVVDHAGAWRAGEGENRPGLIMPGQPLLGARYYQEIAPGVALDRAEIVALDVRAETPAGAVAGCFRQVETMPLEPRGEEEGLLPGRRPRQRGKPDTGARGYGGRGGAVRLGTDHPRVRARAGDGPRLGRRRPRLPRAARYSDSAGHFSGCLRTETLPRWTA